MLVIGQIMAEEMTAKVGLRGHRLPERVATRNGTALGSVALGGRMVPVQAVPPRSATCRRRCCSMCEWLRGVPASLGDAGCHPGSRSGVRNLGRVSAVAHRGTPRIMAALHACHRSGIGGEQLIEHFQADRDRGRQQAFVHPGREQLQFVADPARQPSRQTRAGQA